ncbi:hypothetical protein UFOVP119_5 [uncultured Caudovirales phage]|uniref:Uncharacterized protein n=1 Tax=uncultured Caudovirales phage TaxID=2100421 RepID=A0A6J5L7H8_9CAUD|nr:hypothetical protein UFOVP119_5 [uncultured Caudovirales phage]
MMTEAERIEARRQSQARYYAKNRERLCAAGIIAKRKFRANQKAARFASFNRWLQGKEIRV